jgi:glycosyltransferase involved in cell wall biosynthesis
LTLRLVVDYGRPSRLQTDLDHASGGIKSAILGLSTALAGRGHEVHVFGHRLTAKEWDGVQFHDREGFAAFARETTADVLIAVPEVLSLMLPLRAKARVVWTGNAHRGGDCALVAQPDPRVRSRDSVRLRLYGLNLLDGHYDRIVVKSEWQAGYLAEELGISRDLFRVRYNGVRLELYGGPPPPRHRSRLIYASQARRGLDVLLEVFPRIRERVPDATLHIVGYEPTASGRNGLDNSHPGVVWRGTLGKAELAHELRSAALLAYPCTLKETFCTAVAEAQAAGLPVVTTDRAALSERVSHGADGLLVPGSPHEPGYQSAFVDHVVRLLRDARTRQEMSEHARSKAHRDYHWGRIAALWEEDLLRLTSERLPTTPPLLPNLVDTQALLTCDDGSPVDEGVATAELVRVRSTYGFAGVNGE